MGVPHVAGAGEHGSEPAPATPPQRRITLLPTGFASAECSLAIGPDGTLVVGPAFGRSGVGVVRSRDRGETWELRVPDGAPHRRIQPFTYVDRETGRLFFKTARFDVMPPRPFATGYDLSRSDDLGDTWTSAVAGRRMRDWSKLIAGPAPVDDDDGRRITYLTGPVPFSTRIWPLVPQRYQGVERSRDGGATWDRVDGNRRLGIDPAREPGVGRWEHINYGNGVVGPDGTLWIAGRRGRQLAVASSSDAGANWDVHRVPGSVLRRYRNPLHYVIRYSNYLVPEAVALDDAGTLLAVWPDERDVLRGAWSADRGATWSEPLALAVPGVDEIRYTSVVARPGVPGTFALAYYGRERSRGRAFTAYLTEVSGIGGAAAPSIAGGAITDAPLFPRGFDPGYLRILLGGDLNEMLQARYAPDGALYLACAARITGGNRGRYPWDPASARRGGPLRNPMQAVVARLEPEESR